MSDGLELVSAVTAPITDPFRRRLLVLQQISAALARSRTAKDAFAATIRRCQALLGASRAVGYRFDPERGTLTLVAHAGLTSDEVAPIRELPLAAPTAAALAIRTGAPVWLPNRDAVLATIPGGAEAGPPVLQKQAACALPLRPFGRTSGALAFTFPEPREFDEDERQFLLMIADQCQLAVERASAAEAEVEARRRLELLSGVGDLLGREASFDVALARLAEFVVPALADWCAIDVVSGGAVQRVAVHHPDPYMRELAHEMQRRWPPDPNAPIGVPNVLRTGEPERGEVTDELLAMIPDPEQLAMFRELQLRSYLVLPLAHRGRMLGAMTLVFGESGRRFDAERTMLAMEVGRRASMYLDNLRLLGEAERARAHLADVFRQAPIATALLTGPDHAFALANQRYVDLIGRDPVGRPAREVFAEVADGALLEPLEHVVRTGEPVVGTEIRLHLGPGRRERWFDLVYHPMRTVDEGIGGIMVCAYDVTDQVLARLQSEEIARERARSEARFRTLVEATTAIVWTATAEGRVVEPSPSWLAFTGQSPEAYVDGGYADAIHPEDRAASAMAWARAIDEGTPYDAEYRLQRPDGTYAHMIARAAPVAGPDGVIREYVGCNIDVSARVQAEARLRESAETLETINQVGRMLAAELDQEKLVQALTDAATHLTGARFGAFFYNVVDESGASYMLYAISGVPREAFSSFPMPRRTAVFGPTFAGSEVVRSDDITADPRYGRNAPYHGMPAGHLPVRSYLAVPVVSRVGKVLGGLFFGHPDPGVFTDRAERLAIGLAAQAAVAMDNAALYSEAQRLIAALERSNAELDQFAYVASHDLKAPLRGISNLSQWIEEDASDRLDEEARGHLVLLRRRVHRMEALIDGILSYSRAGRARASAESVDTGKLVAEVIELLEPEPSARIEVVGELPTVRAERVPLQQIFLNLIGNALKHGGRADPHVRVSATEQRDRVEFAVADDGVGIAPEFQDRIWGIFQTLEARDRVESTGIGLAVVKKIVETRGGRAWVESAPGAGATFRFTWPKQDRGDGR